MNETTFKRRYKALCIKLNEEIILRFLYTMFIRCCLVAITPTLLFAQHTSSRTQKQFSRIPDTIIHKNLLDSSLLYFEANKADSAVLYGQKAKRLAIAMDSREHLSRSLNVLAGSYQLSGNSLKALETALADLKIQEELNSQLGIGLALGSVAAFYDDLDDSRQSINYSKKAYEIFTGLKKPQYQLDACLSIGYSYSQLSLPDSALVYFQIAHQLCVQNLIRGSIYAFSLYGLGKVNYQLKNREIAISYYNESIQHIEQSKFNYMHLFVSELVYAGLAESYREVGNRDSAIKFFQKSLDQTVTLNKLTIKNYRNLALLYEGVDNPLAIKYLKLEATLRDSLFNASRIQQVQTLTWNEQERQEIALTAQIKEKNSRLQNLQYSAIAIGAILLLIAYFLLSRTIVASTRLINFMGIVVLLITFEFISLLIHPFLGDITHHSPILMLVGMVGVAAIVVPIHHKLEKWMIAKLLEKNKKIRLAAARKTIAELDVS